MTPTTDTSNHMVEEHMAGPEYLPVNIQQDRGAQQYFHQSIYRHYRNSAEHNPDLPMVWTIFHRERDLSDYRALVALITEQTAYPIRELYSSDVWLSQQSQRALGPWLLAQDPHEELTVMARNRVQELESVLREKIEEAVFYDLAEKWKIDTRFHSSIIEIAMHPAYQRIIGMGMPIVPLILHDLRREPNHWFWALNAITGENPIPPEHQGKMRDMAADWLIWGKAKGYEC